MSHAVVLVLGDDIEGQLAPYDENREVEPYKDYEDLDPERWPVSFLAKEYPDADLTDPHTVARLYNGHWDDGSGKYEVDEKGLFEWSTYNPQSKWDWYTVGGRWAGTLLVKPLVAAAAPNVHVNQFSAEIAAQERQHFAPVMDGRHTDQARFGEIDWEGMRLERLAKIDKRWDGYEGVLVKHGPDAAKREAYWTFGIDGDELALGREGHLAREASRHPLHWVQAMVGEGVWREKGRMGWFGASTDGPDERDEWASWMGQFFGGMSDDVLLTVVDYHI